MESLAGQVAIVTGGARGIGFGIATVLRGEGADVVIADVDEQAAVRAAATLAGDGEHAVGIGVDVTTEADTIEMAAEAVSRWGRIDILAANAGIFPHIPLRDLKVADLDAIMAVNLRGALLATQACLPGNIRTPGFDGLGPEHTRCMLAAIPLGRFGEPEDVGWAVRFLAAREAAYVTGQTLIIDGGQVLPESAD